MNKILTNINKTRPYLDYLIFGAILMFFPMISGNPDISWFGFGTLTIVALLIIYAIAALGMNLLMGYAGLASLGTAGFMGLGAYLTHIFATRAEMTFFSTFAITIVVTMILGLVVGLISLRVEGFFLAIATLVVAEILVQMFGEFSQWTGGFGGTSPRPDLPNLNIPLFGLDTPLTRDGTFMLLVVLLILAMMITQRIFKSPTGRALSAMRGSESAAAAMGINIFRYRLLAFAVASGFAGASGSLYMYFIRFTEPTTWNLVLSLFIFAVVVIGGARSVAGTILGTFIVFGVPDLILPSVPIIGDIPGMAFVFTGVVIILVVLFYPIGLIYGLAALWYKIKAFTITKIFKRGVNS